MSDSQQPDDSTDPQNEQPTTPPPADAKPPKDGADTSDNTDYHDHEDAKPREMLAYGLSSIVDEFGKEGYDIMNRLLSIGFGVSPLVAGFLGAIRTVWDGLADPIMAHISDNTRSRWGRRRPYIFGRLFIDGTRQLGHLGVYPEHRRLGTKHPRRAR